ncbi:hypothetical protein Athai_37590 [Actinocatenispora thailandica]|uniref:Glycosyltransferase RgtA/B/C/D-like domain-containing protein n=1 Tax=Actinocatenispora thailandica TaxID=227318 RepID=A0A7R7DRB6_9ACTN|nr:hypothetical protein [Actinocatenispora thailandica]BCJ36256.1 hypothetical protein Athai_37590 [Actinocatenispora thailandica]
MAGARSAAVSGRRDAERGATPGRRFGALAPVLGLYLLAALFGLLVARKLPWSGDTGVHLAVIEQFGRNLHDPPDPMTGVAEPGNVYYSPFTLLQALAFRFGGLDPWTIFRICAVADALLVASGMHHFVRRLSRVPAAPLCALAAVVLVYGTQLLTWSGVYGLASLGLTLYYPSTFALGITLHLWGVLAYALGGGRGWWPYPVAAVLGADVLLDHQFTALGAGFGAIALLLAHLRQLTLRRGLALAGAAVGAAALVAAWPYFSVTSLLGGTGALDAIHRPLYRNIFDVYGLGLLIGVPALALRFLRRRTDPLVLLAALTAVPVCYGLLTGSYAWGRAWPMLLLAGQVAAGIELATALTTGRRPVRVFAGTLAAMVLVVGGWTQAGVLAYLARVPAPIAARMQIKHSWGDYRWLTRHLRPGTRILAGTYHAQRMAPAYRIYPVASVYPEPWLPGDQRRRTDETAMLDPATPPAQRSALLHRYRVRWLVAYPSQAARLRAAGMRLTPVAHSPRYPRDGLYRIG